MGLLPDPIESLVENTVGKVADKLISYLPLSAEDKAKLALQAKQLDLQQEQQDMSLALAQIATNTEEAKNSSVFVAGWRPFIGWVCGFALAYSFIALPFISTIVMIWAPDYKPPTIDLASLIPILMGMLGLGWLHSNDIQAHLVSPVKQAVAANVSK